MIEPPQIRTEDPPIEEHREVVRDRTAKLPRVLGAVGDPSSDCVLVAIGGLHGNEPSGVLGVLSRDWDEWVPGTDVATCTVGAGLSWGGAVFRFGAES